MEFKSGKVAVYVMSEFGFFFFITNVCAIDLNCWVHANKLSVTAFISKRLRVTDPRSLIDLHLNGACRCDLILMQTPSASSVARGLNFWNSPPDSRRVYGCWSCAIAIFVKLPTCCRLPLKPVASLNVHIHPGNVTGSWWATRRWGDELVKQSYVQGIKLETRFRQFKSIIFKVKSAARLAWDQPAGVLVCSDDC